MRYSSKQIFDARKILNSMNTKDLSKLRMALLGGLAANDKKYSLKDLNYEIDQFSDLNHEDLRNNLREFINDIIIFTLMILHIMFMAYLGFSLMKKILNI